RCARRRGGRAAHAPRRGRILRSQRAWEGRCVRPCREPYLTPQPPTSWGPLVHLVERSLQTLRELGRIVVRPEVHVAESRRVGEAVIVDRRPVDPVLPERASHWIHFLVGEPAVARD